MAAKRQFNDVSSKRLEKAIAGLPGLAESLNQQNINLRDIQNIHVFGYGSLPDQPHYMPDQIENAYLWDYSRDMVCKSVRSGTEQSTGLTLGRDQNKGGIVSGAIMTYSTANDIELCEMLEALSNREVVTELPIYKFEMLEIEKENGQKCLAIVCVADPNSPGYYGDGLTPAEKSILDQQGQEQLSRYKKAAKIAEANGQSRKTGRFMTCKSYFDRFVRIPIQLNPVRTDEKTLNGLSALEQKRVLAQAKEQKRLMDLAHEVRRCRADMSRNAPDKYKLLISIEKKQFKNWKKKKKLSDRRRINTNGPRP